MKKSLILFYSLTWLLTLNTLGLAQGSQVKHPVSSISLPPDEIIRRFTAKETELFEAWKEYAYKQESKLQVLGPANTISGEFYQLSEFIFSDAGKRIERILKAPPSTLDRTGLSMTQEDRDALVNLQPFALTTTELPNYKVTYVGKEKIDDLNTYVFDVTPKAMLDPRELKRLQDQKIEGKYFQGKIYVDDIDLQIVKTAGKVVPEFKYRFPRFETYRENIDGHFWFPTYTYGDDTLVFEDKRGSSSYHIRQVVRYTNYRRFSGDVKIREIIEDVPEEPKKTEEGAKDAAPKPSAPVKPANPEDKTTEKKTTTTPTQKPPKKP